VCAPKYNFSAHNEAFVNNIKNAAALTRADPLEMRSCYVHSRKAKSNEEYDLRQMEFLKLRRMEQSTIC